MTNRQLDPLSWGALDLWDVDPADLEVAGQPWAAVIPKDVDNHIDRLDPDLAPAGLARVAIQTEGDPSPDQGRLFAAPDGEDWSVAYPPSAPTEWKL